MSQWKRFKDPSGSYYYFNAVTKVSSRNKPKEYEAWEQQKQALTSLVFCLPLCNSWHLVICFNGAKFYYNGDTGVSQMKLVDEESETLLAKMDRSLLSLLVGVARGFTPRDGRDVYQEVYNMLVELARENKGVAEIQDEPEAQGSEAQESEAQELETQELETQKPEAPEKPQNVLISGYLSSSDEEEEEEEEDEGEKKGDSENAPDAESPEKEHANETLFMDLLNDKDIDPYSTWPLQAKKLLDDPRYHLIPDEKREELFQEWCAQRFEQQKNTPQEEHHPDGDENDDDESTDLNPTKYHYLAHIISKATITPTTIFSDIKKENKRLFKKLQINDQLSKKEQEQFTSKILVYYKRMDLAEREKIFKTIIKRKLNFPPKSDHLSSLVLKETPTDSFELETQLLEIENELLILDEQKNSSIQNEVMYYVLGIKDKLHALKQVLKDNYSI